MHITTTSCYSHLLYLMTRGADFRRAVKQLYIIKPPNFSGEGLNGYIEVEFTVLVDQLDVFTKIWQDWFYLSDSDKEAYYELALCK